MTAGGVIAQRLTALVADSRWQQRVLLLGALAAFYALTAAGNLSEPDDAYAFAYRVERFALTHVSDPRLLGYHALGRGLWLASEALGLGVRGLEILRGIAVLSAPLCLWLVFRILTQRLAVAALPAFLASGFLAASYGFWRYAAEADVYVPAMMLCAGVLYFLLDPRGGLLRHAAIGAAAGLCVLFYQPNAIPLFLVFPLLVLRAGAGMAFTYCAAGSVAAGAGYLLGYFAFWPAPLEWLSFKFFLAQRSEEFIVAPLSLKTIIVSMIRSACALGHDIVSANWVFGLPHAERLVQRAFGWHMIEEEVFLARQAGALIYAPLLILPVAAFAAWRVLWAAWPGVPGALLLATMPVLGLWAALTALIIGRLNPGGIEAWIVFLLPLTLVFALAVIVPACSRQGTRMVCLLLAMFAMHNAIGGMALVQSRQSDLNFLRGEWVIANAGPDDLVIVVGNSGLTESLRYRSRARVEMIHPFVAPILARALLDSHDTGPAILSTGRDFSGTDVHALARQVAASGGRVMVFNHFFMPSGPADRAGDPLAREMAGFKQRSPLLHRASDGFTTHRLTVIGQGQPARADGPDAATGKAAQ